MDVRAKQRLSYQRRLLNFSGLGGGFAPRHLNRWAASRSYNRYEIQSSNFFNPLPCLRKP